MKTVAVMDDDQVLVELYNTILKEEGYNVVPITITSTLDPMLSEIRRSKADLLIVDIRMPGVNIFDLLLGLQTEAGLKYLICSAARNEVESLQQSLQVAGIGRLPVLEKPFDLDDFVVQIENLIGPGQSS